MSIMVVKVLPYTSLKYVFLFFINKKKKNNNNNNNNKLKLFQIKYFIKNKFLI